MAREGADVVSVIFVNHSYRILNIELSPAPPRRQSGRVAEDLLGLGRPEIDWVKKSKAQGVPEVNAATAEEFDAALGNAFATPAAPLIAAHVPARARAGPVFAAHGNPRLSPALVR